MTLLTGLRQGKALIIGEPGLGKTTSAEYVCSLLYRVPLGTIWGSEVSGHPEQTEEKIIGRPDLGRLNQGEEVVVWSHFVLLPTKIVDEINRLPETKQSMILDGVDRGNWEYLNDSVINREYCLFATANYQDGGTNTIIAPLIDRFDIMVESKHPGPNLAFHIGMTGANGSGLRNEELERGLHRVLNQRDSYEDRMDQAEELYNQFGRSCIGVSGCGPSPDRIAKPSAPRWMRFLSMWTRMPSCVWSCPSCPSAITTDRGGFTRGAARAATSLPISATRSGTASPIDFRKVLARFHRPWPGSWATSRSDSNTSGSSCPSRWPHRIQWKEETLARREKEARQDPLPIYMAKEAVREMHRRYIEQAPQLKSALAARPAESRTARPWSPAQGDHPIYWEIRRDLGEEVLDR